MPPSHGSRRRTLQSRPCRRCTLLDAAVPHTPPTRARPPLSAAHTRSSGADFWYSHARKLSKLDIPRSPVPTHALEIGQAAHVGAVRGEFFGRRARSSTATACSQVPQRLKPERVSTSW
jgi:hypothetical protein